MVAIFASLLSPFLPAASAAGDPVQVVVLVILASDQNAKVNERLAEIAAEVRKKDDRLTGFQLQKTINRELEIGQRVTLELVEPTTKGG
jgi:hypothetical protein